MKENIYSSSVRLVFPCAIVSYDLIILSDSVFITFYKIVNGLKLQRRDSTRR